MYVLREIEFHSIDSQWQYPFRGEVKTTVFVEESSLVTIQLRCSAGMTTFAIPDEKVHRMA